MNVGALAMQLTRQRRWDELWRLARTAPLDWCANLTLFLARQDVQLEEQALWRRAVRQFERLSLAEGASLHFPIVGSEFGMELGENMHVRHDSRIFTRRKDVRVYSDRNEELLLRHPRVGKGDFLCNGTRVALGGLLLAERPLRFDGETVEEIRGEHFVTESDHLTVRRLPDGEAVGSWPGTHPRLEWPWLACLRDGLVVVMDAEKGQEFPTGRAAHCLAWHNGRLLAAGETIDAYSPASGAWETLARSGRGVYRLESFGAGWLFQTRTMTTVGGVEYPGARPALRPRYGELALLLQGGTVFAVNAAGQIVHLIPGPILDAFAETDGSLHFDVAVYQGRYAFRYFRAVPGPARALGELTAEERALLRDPDPGPFSDLLKLLHDLS